MGANTVAHTGTRFPLLIKILDCAQWLSLQVHPDDEAAERLEGPGYFGKTEAWHVLDAAPGAQLIAGMRPDTTAEALAAAIRDGTILDFVQYQDVRAGDTVFMPARTIHTLGPGLLIYEVQQTSDLTYASSTGTGRRRRAACCISRSRWRWRIRLLRRRRGPRRRSPPGSGRNWPPARTSPWS